MSRTVVDAREDGVDEDARGPGGSADQTEIKRKSQVSFYEDTVQANEVEPVKEEP